MKFNPAIVSIVVLSLIVIFLCFVFPRGAYHSGPATRVPVSLGLNDDPDAQAEMEFLIQRNPLTNTIPVDIHRMEKEFARRLPGREGLLSSRDTRGFVSPHVLTWIERGPNNVGGRTRVFGADVSNPNNLVAGSVGGGLWKSVDDGASWVPTSSPGQIHNTTCIAQDKRPGSTNTWYVGTGELRGSTNNDTRWGSLYRGDGIFKSTDNGSSWALLPSTSSGTPETTDPFDYNWNVATDPSNLSQDVVYAATYIGIYRSTDGGGSWVNVQPADSSFTDVAVTSTGVVYAFTKNSGIPRIWRSADGITWTNIEPGSFPTAAGRIVFGVAPSNPNVVYVFVQGPNNTPAVGGHQLWKYTYISGNGSGAGGTWENRGNNLPGDINTQTGYDMLVHVKPDDEGFVLIGGTNLYRSTDGFASTGFITTIGGYPFWPGLNHHPDLHSGSFRPGSPNVYYSSHDGGISKILDITSGSISWFSLNNGYNVTQFYSVSIAPEAGSNVLLAGAQDNGTQLGDAPGASSWVMAFGGDGTVVKVAPLADDRLYTQYQGGQMQRMQRDLNNVFFMTPNNATNMLFVNPIVLDPNNSSLLYYPAGSSSPSLNSAIWRNDNAPNADGSTGWSVLSTSDVGTAVGYTRRITALGISKANNPNVLYYGTVDGIVKRADNAHTPTPTITTITPPGLNGGTSTGGFVRGIAVDPANSNKALVCFGNYNFQSIWYTTNGGSTWTDVEGNLAGPSGPSVRFALIFYIGGQMQAFLATSIGVLSTTLLNGSSTVWVQEAAMEIGNIPVGYLDYRDSDQTLAIGTHARGVFTTQFETPTVVSVNSGWNMISSPVETPNDTIAVLFPSHAPPAFSYATGIGYQVAVEMENGPGYWVKFPSGSSFNMFGTPIETLNIGVLPGWNLVGAVVHPVSIQSIVQSPPNNVVSYFYGFNSAGFFQADTLFPGKAYWVKVNQAGQLTLQ